MPDLNAWLGSTESVDAASRAVRAWTRINRVPASIVIVREGVALPAQTMRVEYNNSTSSQGIESPAGRGDARTLVLFGVKDHPTVAATNIRAGDRFRLVSGGPQYDVKNVILAPGEMQATAEMMT